MEGDRILRVLKSECSLIGIVNDVKDYLRPVLSSDSHKPTTNVTQKSVEENSRQFGKYELFSLKLLKQCIETWKNATQDTPTLLEIGSISVDSLIVCSNSSGKAPPLSFEKLLFHFASQCINCGCYEAGMQTCLVLSDRLKREAVQNVPKLLKEGQSLLRHSYDLLWKAAAKIEQNATKLGSTDLESVELSLELRKTAFLCLISVDFDLCFLFERVVRSDLRYQKVCSGCHGNHSSCNSFQRLYAFHVSLLQSKDLCALIDHAAPCRMFSSGVEYLLALAKVCMGAGRKKEGERCIAKSQSLCQLHAEVCHEKFHLVGTVRTQVAELSTLVTETEICTSTEHQEMNFPGDSLRLFESIASGLESVVKSRALDSTSLPRLIDSLEALVSLLENRREEFQERTEREKGRDASYCPKQVFLYLQTILAVYVNCLESHPSLSTESSIRSRQLSMLSVLCRFLLDLLLAEEESDGYDEIEIARSSLSRPIQPSSTPHPKKDLADLCLPVLSSSQNILKKASPGLLSAVEHKYLGNTAYNIGLALYRCELYHESSSVLELACWELGVWCAGGERSEEEISQVLKKLTLLFDCHRQARQFHQLLASIESAITSLPANQITAPNCASLLASQWVEAKKETIAMHSEQARELGQKTLLEVLSRHSFPREVKAVYLQEELRMCKTLSPAHPSFQLAAVEAQLVLYGEEWEGEGGIVGRARATTELAALRRVLREDSESSPLELLDEALSFLDPLVSAPDHTPLHLLCQAQEQLALVHMWRAICTQEQLMSSCDLTPPTSLPATNEGGHPAKPDEQENDQENSRDRLLCLSPAQEEAILGEDSTECLLLAVQAWEGLWGTLRERGCGKSKAQECLYDHPSTFQWLHLTSSLCLAHRKPLLALRTLGVLIEVFHWAPSPELRTPYQQALAQYYELALEVGVGENYRARLESALAGTTPSEPSLKGRGLLELEASHLTCQLALARSKLERGLLEDCRRLLVGIFESPLLSRHNTIAYHLTARAKAVTAHYLQHSRWTLKPGNEFLQYLLSEHCEPLESGSFRLTPLELYADAARLCRGLANSSSVSVPLSTSNQDLSNEYENQGHPSPAALSPQASAWSILHELFSSLRSLARTYLVQGGVREAHCYAREGLVLAKSLLLQGWYVEFLLLLAEVQQTRGEHSSSRAVLLQAARLMDLHSYLSATFVSSSPPPPAHEDATEDGDRRPRGDTTKRGGPETSDSELEDSLLEEFQTLKIDSTLEVPRYGTSLPLHPTACLCSSCSNPVCLLHSVSTLHLWVGLELEGVGQGGHDTDRLLQILSEASELGDACRQKCNRALGSLPQLDVFRREQRCDANSKTKSKQRKTKKPSITATGEPPLCLDHSSAWVHLLLRSCAVEAETLLAHDDPPGCLASVSSTLSGVKSAAASAPEYSTALARLHYMAGVATLRRAEKGDPSTSRDQLWQNSSEDHARLLPEDRTRRLPKGATKRPARGGRQKQKVAATEVVVISSGESSDEEIVLPTKRGRRPRKLELSSEEEEERAPARGAAARASSTAPRPTSGRGQRRQRGAAKVEEEEVSADGGPSRRQRGTTAGKASGRRGRRPKGTTQGTGAGSGGATDCHPTQGSSKATANSGVGNSIHTESGKAVTSTSTSSLMPKSLGTIPEAISTALGHFLAAYQLCYPTAPAHLLRDVCHWLCVCLSCYHPGLAFHFLTLGTQLTLGHQAVYALGKRIRNSPGSDSMQQSPFQDVLDTLSTAPSRASKCHPSPHHTPTLAARNTLTLPPTPPPLSHTSHLLNSLPENWTVCCLSLAPKIVTQRGIPSDSLGDTRDHLLVARARQGEGPQVVKIPVTDSSAVQDLRDILSASGASMTLTDKRSWWSTRRQLDELIKELLDQLETSWLGSWKFLLEPPTDTMATGGSSGPIILLLGQTVQALPWEATPTLAKSSVGRMPSLMFTVAHRHLLGHSGSVLADPRKTFYVLNPRGDLPNTEKVFAGWFTRERGWRGVVGRSPTTEEFTVALQDHSLFVYCGHGTGREYLNTDGFHQVCCQATTILMGCSSGRLTGGGACDPGGVAFSYLMAGCPSLVANLWDVTDGDIDRFCQALLKSWLRDPKLPLSSYVSDSRSACKLQQLVGASPVLYGVPLAYTARQK